MSRRSKPSNEETLNEETLEVGEGRIDAASRLDREAVRARAAASDLLPEEALDERQAAIGQERRRGGPALDAQIAEAAAPAPEVLPTECEEPAA